jgi:hypothetical protein
MNIIEAEAQFRLCQSDNKELHGIRCTFRRGILTLNGIVPNSHVRQVAQKLIQDLEGIQVIDNQLVTADKSSP